MIYRLKDSKIKVILGDAQVDEIISFVRLAQNQETGGILLGSYGDLTTAIVKNISGPPSDSKCGRYSFVRGVKGLSTILRKAWKRNEYYLGEWHYHPNGTVTPSFQDINQMKKIAKNNRYNCPEPVMIIIAGNPLTYNLAVFLTMDDKTYQLNLESD